MSFDFGLLQPYINDPKVTDIDSNGTTVYIDHLEKGLMKVLDLEKNYIKNLLNRLVNDESVNEQLNYEKPVIDCVLEGLRIHGTHDSYSVSGYTIRIRKNPLDLVITSDMAKKSKYCHINVFVFLNACMQSKLSIIFGGEVGTGKTQLMKTTLSLTNEITNIILISDIDEMRMNELFPTRNITQYVINDIMDYTNTTSCVLRDNGTYICFQEVRDSAVDDLFLVLSSSARVLASVHLKSSLLMPQRLVQLSNNKNDSHLLTTIHDYIQVCVMPVKEIINGVIHRYIGEIALFWNDENMNPCKQLIYKQRGNDVQMYEIPNYFKKYFVEQNIKLDWSELSEKI